MSHATLLPTLSRAVLKCLEQCIAAPTMKGPMAATIHEFEDCVYSVEHSSEAPECAVLSFSHRYELSAAAREHASKAYAGIAEVQVPAEASFQISLKVGRPGAWSL